MTKPTGTGRGRPKGAKNKRTRATERRVAAVAKTIAKVIPRAFEGNAHAYLMAVYKDPEVPRNERIDAAKAAMAYEVPKLQSVLFGHDPSKPATVIHKLDETAAQTLGKVVAALIK